MEKYRVIQAMLWVCYTIMIGMIILIFTIGLFYDLSGYTAPSLFEASVGLAIWFIWTNGIIIIESKNL